MNYHTMTSKQLSQALTEAKVKGRSKATTKAQKIALLLNKPLTPEISKPKPLKDFSLKELKEIAMKNGVEPVVGRRNKKQTWVNVLNKANLYG